MPSVSLKATEDDTQETDGLRHRRGCSLDLKPKTKERCHDHLDDTTLRTTSASGAVTREVRHRANGSRLVGRSVGGTDKNTRDLRSLSHELGLRRRQIFSKDIITVRIDRREHRTTDSREKPKVKQITTLSPHCMINYIRRASSPSVILNSILITSYHYHPPSFLAQRS